MTTPDRLRDGAAAAVILRVERLAYGGRDLFRDFEARLLQGRFTALLGPSGVGKSTLLHLIAGIGPEDAAATAEMADGAPAARAAAFMGQRDLLLPWLTALDNAALGARLRGEPLGPARERARALLDAVGLGAATGLKPPALSGGMRQRVALARTLAEDRPIVLMDEPFSQLDAITRHGLQDTAARLLAGKTVLMVTHDPAEALRLGDIVWTLAGAPARLIEQAPPPGAPPRPLTAELAAAEARLLETLARESGEAGFGGATP